jgi:hypothetical protein
VDAVCLAAKVPHPPSLGARVNRALQCREHALFWFVKRRAGMSRRTPDEIETMADLRVCIDEIDSALVAQLAERERYTDRAPAV